MTSSLDGDSYSWLTVVFVREGVFECVRMLWEEPHGPRQDSTPVTLDIHVFYSM